VEESIPLVESKFSNGVSITSNEVTLGKEAVPGAVVLSAEIQLKSVPEQDAQGRLLIPSRERQLCERGLEIVADVLSVMLKRRRSIASPLPCVGLIPEDEPEAQLLEASAGIYRPTMPSIAANDYPPNIGVELAAKLGDRFDGVQLLSEVHSQVNVLGMYRGLVRFFEAAFGIPFVQAHGRMSKVLSAGHLGYGKAEIEKWTALRHGATHGDRLVTPDLVFEAEVWPYIGKMIDAAYDILMNKETWGDKSSGRRNIWRPLAYLQEDGSMSITEGQEFRNVMRVSDEFGVFPLIFDGLSLPTGWWYRAADPSRPVLGQQARSPCPASSVSEDRQPPSIGATTPESRPADSGLAAEETK